jgi:hypothetical protein
MWYARGRREMQTVFWLENLNKSDHLEDHGIVGIIILKWILKKQNQRGGGMRTQDRESGRLF